MITQEQINEMLKEAMPDIIASMKEDLKTKINWQAQEEAAKQVREAVGTWMKEEIIPEIHTQLVESKDGLITVGAQLGQQMVPVLVEALLAELKKKLESSWERTKIFEAMFK